MDAAEDPDGAQLCWTGTRKSRPCAPVASPKVIFDVFAPVGSGEDGAACTMAVPDTATHYDLDAGDLEITKLEQDDHSTLLPPAAPKPWADVTDEDFDLAAFQFASHGISDFKSHARATLPDVFADSGDDGCSAITDEEDVVGHLKDFSSHDDPPAQFGPLPPSLCGPSPPLEGSSTQQAPCSSLGGASDFPLGQAHADSVDEGCRAVTEFVVVGRHLKDFSSLADRQAQFGSLPPSPCGPLPSLEGSSTQQTPCSSLGGASSVISPTSPGTPHPVESAPESRRTALSSGDEGVTSRLKDFPSLGQGHADSVDEELLESVSPGNALQDKNSSWSPFLQEMHFKTGAITEGDVVGGRLKDLGYHDAYQALYGHLPSSQCGPLASWTGSSTQQAPCALLGGATTTVISPTLSDDPRPVDLAPESHDRLKDFKSPGRLLDGSDADDDEYIWHLFDDDDFGTQCGQLPQHQLESTQFGPLTQSQSSVFPTSRTQCGHSPRTVGYTVFDLGNQGCLQDVDSPGSPLPSLDGMKDTLAHLVNVSSAPLADLSARYAALEAYAAATRQFELALGSTDTQFEPLPQPSLQPISSRSQSGPSPQEFGPSPRQAAKDKKRNGSAGKGIGQGKAKKSGSSKPLTLVKG